MNKLRKEIEDVINHFSAENVSDTPDFILSEYLINCLKAFDDAVNRREEWYGRCYDDDEEVDIPIGG